VRVLRIVLEKGRIRPFIDALNDVLGVEQRKMLVEQAASRLDDNGAFFLRLGKEEWLAGRARLTDSGDCFHISINIVSYPKKRELLLQNVAKIFNVG
jgi:RNA binding exosome subunit